MGVTFTQPNYATQGSDYPVNIQEAVAVMARIAAAFHVQEQSTPDMTVKVLTGHIPKIGALGAEVAETNTGTITAPTTNPRYDIVYIDATTGAVAVATGSEAASPSDPAISSGKIALARISLTVGQTEIVAADITDLRNLGMLNVGTAAGMLLALDAAGKMPAVDGSQLTNLTAVLPLGYMSGLDLSIDGGDADHDVLIASGVARDKDDSEDMSLAAAITKQIDAAWSVGDDAGGLDTGTVAADTWYYVHLIKNTTSGVVDVLFSTSSTAPTMPSGYTKSRRLGGFQTDASANFSGAYIVDHANGTQIFEGAEQTAAASTVTTVNHGLETEPFLIFLYAICTSATDGYSVGDKLLVPTPDTRNNGAVVQGPSLSFNATDINISMPADVADFTDKNSGGNAILGSANWNLIIRATT